MKDTITITREQFEHAVNAAVAEALPVAWRKLHTNRKVLRLTRPRPLTVVMEHMRERGLVKHAEVLQFAYEHDGEISRDQVYAIMGYPQDRSLRGYGRPFNTAAAELNSRKRISRDLPPTVLITMYGEPGIATGFRIHPEWMAFKATTGTLSA